MNIIFDGNFLAHKCFSVWQQYHQGEDIAEVISQPENQQVLVRKFVIDLCATLQRFSQIDCVVVVFDSRSWRYSLHDDYKYALTRTKDPWKDHFFTVLAEFESLLSRKGIITSRVQGAEGDDLMYLWSIYFDQVLDEQCCCITADSDMRQIITQNVSIFNNNSKNLRCFTHPVNEVFWHEYHRDDVVVQAVNPFEVVLYKAIMGDKNDNIPKLKKGFGEKGFERFIQHITPYDKPDNPEFIQLAQWIAGKFSDFIKIPEDELLGQIIFNLKMTWLNLSVYNETDYMTENGKSLLENMLEDIANKKDGYNYKLPYTLENIYGMLIK